MGPIKLLSEAIQSIAIALGTFNRTVRAADAIVEAAEVHACRFRDQQLAELRESETDLIKQFREEREAKQLASTTTNVVPAKRIAKPKA